MKQPKNIKEVREVLAEAAETAWKDKSFIGRATVVVNAMGKINGTLALELKQAELAKKLPDIDFLKY